jgi:hypothetical protein
MGLSIVLRTFSKGENITNMEKTYRVKYFMDGNYKVVEILTIYGERINAYESEMDKVTETTVFNGSLSDCEAYIRLKENGYM